LAVAAAREWKIFHLDVKTAFFNGYLNEIIYMVIPKGFELEANAGLI
jgi:hypothetical protein